MDILAVFNPDGTPFAFYSEEINGPRFIDGEKNPNCIIPDEVTEITEDQWNAFLNNQGTSRWDGNDVVIYTPVPVPVFDVPASVSVRQFAQQLSVEGVITREEAIAWAASRILPPAMLGALDMIPDEDVRWEAQMQISGAVEYERSNPFVQIIGVILQKDNAALDELWIAASKL